ncbi:aconitase/3-isopropylmalate dehydratase large subunit family protein [Halalkalibaculum sp. DA3122]|uniref:3-isopropylmalate dehydratase large subunit n=1 Tax=unclassified Halalkalibaculum TaxID=2964617 RepID=UPI00375475C4
MGMTLTEKILAKHSGASSVEPGESVWVDVDVLMTHDVCGPPSISIFRNEFGEDARVWDKEKLVIIPDHYIFTKDKYANRNVDILRAFAADQDLPYYYDVGSDDYKGVCHIALPEEGFTRPGEVLFGTDSHTCTAGAFGQFATGIGNTDAAFIMGTGKLWVKVPETMRFVFEGNKMPEYLMAKDIILQIIGDIGVDGATYRTMEFAGEGISAMTMEDRMTITNMVIEAGGKNGVVEPDEKTEAYVKERTDKPFEPVYSDEDANYHSEYTYQLDKLVPMVAKPHSPDNKATAEELEGTELDRAYIGSCTGGKLSDFVAAAEIIDGQELKLETFIVPATTEIKDGLKTTKVNGRTLLDIFEEAGCHIGNASCAACLGGPSDTFGRLNNEERCISSTNRNYPGRMGSKQAQVYLASPYTVAASAVTGSITDPRAFIN